LVVADEQKFPFPWALAPVIGTLLLIASSVRNERNFITTVLASRSAVAIGRISYSLYLWHWVVIVFLRWTVGIESLSAQVAAAVLTLALSWASYALVEKPIRYMGVLQTIRYVPFYAGFAVVMFAATTASVALYVKRHAISLSARQTSRPGAHTTTVRLPRMGARSR
jgi:peptidoglycan/LPS O-acetylase OafA/YrhL